ncbi:hypothetical protein AB0I53_08480 [Saccharopolyspora sp. NPDC050389]|uniref:hypothetical protein n=1 Tax=Saccharopolyspora sp. NPDC050389 TaxID=3155516 RepID=UPI0033CC9E70
MRRFLSAAVLAAAFAGATAGLAHAQDQPWDAVTLPAPACESGTCATASGQDGHGQDANGQDGYGQDGTAHAVAVDEGQGQ